MKRIWYCGCIGQCSCWQKSSQVSALNCVSRCATCPRHVSHHSRYLSSSHLFPKGMTATYLDLPSSVKFKLACVGQFCRVRPTLPRFRANSSSSILVGTCLWNFTCWPCITADPRVGISSVPATTDKSSYWTSLQLNASKINTRVCIQRKCNHWRGSCLLTG